MKNGSYPGSTRRLLLFAFVGGVFSALPHVAFSQSAPDFSVSDDLLRGALQDHRPGDVYVDRRYSDGRRAVQAVNRSNVSRIVAANAAGAPVSVGTFSAVSSAVSPSRFYNFLSYVKNALGRLVPAFSAIDVMFNPSPLNVGSVPQCASVSVHCCAYSDGSSCGSTSLRQYDHCLASFDDENAYFRYRGSSGIQVPPGGISMPISPVSAKWLSLYNPPGYPAYCGGISSISNYRVPRVSECQLGAAACLQQYEPGSNTPTPPELTAALPSRDLYDWSQSAGNPRPESAPYTLPAPHYAPDITVYPDVFEPLPASVPEPSPDAPPMRITEPRFLPGLVTGTTTGTTTTTNSDGSTSTSQTSTQSEFQLEFPNQLDVNVLNWPAALGGTSPAEPLPPPAPIDGVIPEIVVDLPALDFPGSQVGSCPPPVSIDVGSYGSVELSYEPVCAAATYVRPLVLIGAALAALSIVFGAGMAGRGD